MREIGSELVCELKCARLFCLDLLLGIVFSQPQDTLEFHKSGAPWRPSCCFVCLFLFFLASGRSCTPPKETGMGKASTGPSSASRMLGATVGATATGRTGHRRERRHYYVSSAPLEPCHHTQIWHLQGLLLSFSPHLWSLHRFPPLVLFGAL